MRTARVGCRGRTRHRLAGDAAAFELTEISKLMRELPPPERWRTIMRAGLAAEELLGERSFTVIRRCRPQGTRRASRLANGRCRSDVLGSLPLFFNGSY